ncbi:hypothetical protein [Pseudoalteromonas phage PH357]|nr:hypothetical protein [Pseudoalteromonas phage PH357]
MSNFKKGDLVEVVNHPTRADLLGERFKLCKGSHKNILDFDGKSVIRKFVWETPFKSILEDFRDRNVHLSEDFLRKVNPDGDNLSEYTFEELMNNLKLPNKEKHNV